MDRNGLKEVTKLVEDIDTLEKTSKSFFKEPYLINIRITHQADHYGNGRGDFEIPNISKEVIELTRKFYHDLKKAVMLDLETKNIKFGEI